MQKIKILILLLTIFNVCPTKAQVKISSSFNDVDIHMNMNVLIEKEFGKFSIALGPKMAFNNLVHDNNNNVYRKRFYATTFNQHFGLDLFFKYMPLFTNWNLKPQFFYNLQITKSQTRNQIVIPYSNDAITGEVLYVNRLELFGPFTAFESNIGIGFEQNIVKKFYLRENLGSGVVLITGKDKKRPETLFNKVRWEFSHLFSVGFGYRFGNKQ